MQVEVRVKEDDGSERFWRITDAVIDMRLDTMDTPPVNFCKTRKALDTGVLLVWGKLKGALVKEDN